MEGMRFVARPGPVSPAERRVLETHPSRGHALLAGAGVDPLDTAATIALTHHERFDGSGYPQRLSGEAIPLVGRIVAVADTFDAFTTDRPHRAARTVEDALMVLRTQQFDAHVVDALVDLLDAVLAVQRLYPDDEGPLVSPQEAAAMLSLSTSQLRRLADEGHLPTRRTSGGHRRFPLTAVQRLAVETAPSPVRPLTPPDVALPRLAQLLATRGGAFAVAAASAVYAGGPPGWFASSQAAPLLETWIGRVADSCSRGRYARALTATHALMHRAQSRSAALLERHSFLERFGQVTVRELLSAGEQAEAVAARRLIVSLQQALLSET